jgi:hypothetical protein
MKIVGFDLHALIPTTREDGLLLEARSSASGSSARGTQVCVTSSCVSQAPQVDIIQRKHRSSPLNQMLTPAWIGGN